MISYEELADKMQELLKKTENDGWSWCIIDALDELYDFQDKLCVVLKDKYNLESDDFLGY